MTKTIIALAFSLVALTAANVCYASSAQLLPKEAPILIEPASEYSSYIPHFDPLHADAYDSQFLHIYDDGLWQSFNNHSEWRQVPPINSFYEVWKANEDDIANLPASKAKNGSCAQYIAVGWYGSEEVENDLIYGGYCYARAALTTLGVPTNLKVRRYSFGAPVILEHLFEFLPMAYFALTYGPRPDPMPSYLGLPNTATMTWPAEAPHGSSAVRVEHRLSVSEQDAKTLLEQAYRFKNGLYCAPNKACTCQQSPTCLAYLIGLLAAWQDKEGSDHWLLYAVSRHEFGYAAGAIPDYSRLFHVVRKPGGIPKLDHAFLLDIPALVLEPDQVKQR